MLYVLARHSCEDFELDKLEVRMIIVCTRH